MWNSAYCRTTCGERPKTASPIQGGVGGEAALLMLYNFSLIIVIWFLGGLSLHLNHLIASHAANYDWPFGTLPFGLFGSNLDTRDLETYPRTYSGHFWNMSIFDDSRAIWVLFRKWVVSENCILLGNGWPIPGYSDLILGGEVSRLSHGQICFPIQNTYGVLRAVESWVPLFWHFHEGIKAHLLLMYCIKNLSIGVS